MAQQSLEPRLMALLERTAASLHSVHTRTARTVAQDLAEPQLAALAAPGFLAAPQVAPVAQAQGQLAVLLRHRRRLVEAAEAAAVDLPLTRTVQVELVACGSDTT